jgi:hypothetical protein
MDQLPAQLVQLLAPFLCWKVKPLPLHSWREHREEPSTNGINESTTACPFVYSFPIR